MESGESKSGKLDESQYRKSANLKLAMETEELASKYPEEIDNQIMVLNKKRTIFRHQHLELRYVEALIIQLKLEVLRFQTGGSTAEVFRRDMKETLKKIETGILEIDLGNQ